MRDELKAIKKKRLQLENGQIVNTIDKLRKAEKLRADFCPNPACSKAFSRLDLLTKHLQESRQCAKLTPCKNCKKCSKCSKYQRCIYNVALYLQGCAEMISILQLELAIQMGYVPLQ
jgi:hypothetical protein